MFGSNNIISNFNHTLKMGDSMIKMYGNKIVKLEFVFNENGDDLKTIINRTFKEELYKKKLLFGGVLDELQKTKKIVDILDSYQKGGIRIYDRKSNL